MILKNNKNAAFTLAEGGRRPLFNSGVRRAAFTLAEILITLAIIGIVAALTIPALVHKYEEKATITKVKKVYSVLSNALQLAYIEQGDYNPENDSKVAGAPNFYQYLSNYLKFEKYCGNEKGCWPDTMIKFLHGDDWVNINTYENYTKAVLADGTLIQIYYNGEIRVDTNGFKGPNTLGRDIFLFLTEHGKVIPRGMPEDSKPFETHCNMASNLDYNGDSCTAWIVTHGNMDYLHCNDLSWNGKHKCSD